MKKFNLRVYGILFSENKILLTHEWIDGKKVTKFPGGGLEWGEGIYDCLKREMQEELGIAIHEAEHFYTTDFFQQSAFNPNDQLISVYYKIPYYGEQFIPENGDLIPEWIEHKELLESHLTFPVDKKVVQLLAKG